MALRRDNPRLWDRKEHEPMLYVTHDPAEVAALCDEVLVMERGRFVRQGKPDGIFADFSATLAADGHSGGRNG